LPFEQIFAEIAAEFKPTRDLGGCKISGHGRPALNGDPALQLLVDLRNRTIIPLGFPFKLPCCADSGTRTASHR